MERHIFTIWGTSSVQGQIIQNLRFPGQHFDSESGWNHNGVRDYAQNWGRYLQTDPIGLNGGVNTYTYARSSPIKFVDRSGKIVPLILVAEGGEALWLYLTSLEIASGEGFVAFSESAYLAAQTTTISAINSNTTLVVATGIGTSWLAAQANNFLELTEEGEGFFPVEEQLANFQGVYQLSDIGGWIWEEIPEMVNSMSDQADNPTTLSTSPLQPCFPMNSLGVPSLSPGLFGSDFGDPNMIPNY